MLAGYPLLTDCRQFVLALSDHLFNDETSRCLFKSQLDVSLFYEKIIVHISLYTPLKRRDPHEK